MKNSTTAGSDGRVPFGVRLRRRAWSRAGAIAAVLGRRPTRRVLSISTRFALLAIGSVLIAASVAVILWTGLGPGPLDVFIGAIRQRTGASLTIVVWGTMGLMLAVASLLGRRPGVGSILSPLAVGPVMQFGVDVLDSIDVPSSLLVRFAIHLLAIGGIGLGAGALIVSGLGAGSGELLASAASDHSGRPEPWMRTACESTWLVTGVLLGGPIGLGTVVVALAIGPSVGLGFRTVDTLVARSRRRLDADRELPPVPALV